MDVGVTSLAADVVGVAVDASASEAAGVVAVAVVDYHSSSASASDLVLDCFAVPAKPSISALHLPNRGVSTNQSSSGSCHHRPCCSPCLRRAIAADVAVAACMRIPDV